MKKLIILLGLIVLTIPIISKAETLPAFPMSFWGNISVNGTLAPAGSVIKAYYGSILAGEVTTKETGVYGYSSPFQPRLVVASGNGVISFTITSSLTGNTETSGNSAQTHSAFQGGSLIQQDFNFTYSISNSGGGGGGGGSGGGGGGGGSGGGGGFIAPIITIATTTVTSTTQTTTTVPIQSQVLGAATIRISRNLGIGRSGEDVTSLQQFLMDNNFYSGPITGYFGPLTRAAVIRYQTANGIEGTGFVGVLTRGKLNSSQVAGATLDVDQIRAKIQELQAQIQALLLLLQQMQSKNQ